jgi:hypothetical protein
MKKFIEEFKLILKIYRNLGSLGLGSLGLGLAICYLCFVSGSYPIPQPNNNHV